MNSLKIYTLIIALSLSVPTLAQNFTRIHKNVNSTASGLQHNLNKFGDSIRMTSDKQIFRVSFLSHKEKETVEVDLGSFEANIPLYHFSEGRYTIAVYREDMIIAFDIVRERPIGIPEDAVADLEESILRSSLPEEEQRKRNLKPRSKRNNDTRLANVNKKPDNSRAKAEAKERDRKDRVKREAQAAAKRKKALAQAEAETKQRIKKEAQVAAKRERDIAEAKVKEAEDKIKREKAIVEANREKLKKKALAETRKKEAREDAIAQANKKSKEALEKAKLDKTRNENSIASNKKVEELDVKEVKYNISDIEHNQLEKQSREEYRKENLRPNGTKYDEAIEEEKKNKSKK